MNMLDMYRKLDVYVKNIGEEQASNIDVVVSTSESSIGARGCVQVEMIYPGFDWESGQLRVEVREKIYKSMNRTATKMLDNNTYWCGACAIKVGKQDKFCKNCGVQLRDSK